MVSSLLSNEAPMPNSGAIVVGSSGHQLQSALDFFKGLDLSIQTVEEMRSIRELDLRATWVDDHGEKQKARWSLRFGYLKTVFNSTPLLNLDDLVHIKCLENIRSLDLSFNFLGDEVGSSLSNLKLIQSLKIGSNCIGVDGARFISELTSLEELDMNSNNVDANALELLSKLQELRSLNLYDNRVGDGGIRFIPMFPKLISLDVSANRIGDTGIRELAKSTSLQWLDVSCNEITNLGAAEIAKIASLWHLGVSNNKITAEGVAFLAKLHLYSFDISRNEIGDEGVEKLTKMTPLSSLNLERCSITEIGIAHLFNLPFLKSLKVGENFYGRKGDTMLEELASQGRLRTLDIGDLHFDIAKEQLYKTRQNYLMEHPTMMALLLKTLRSRTRIRYLEKKIQPVHFYPTSCNREDLYDPL